MSSTPNRDVVNPDDVDIREVLLSTATRLHGIVSRSTPDRIAAEVLRLNDAVRAVAAERLDAGEEPGNFAQRLVELADGSNGGAA